MLARERLALAMHNARMLSTLLPRADAELTESVAAAAGGLGLAAVQVCRARGGLPLGTAGSAAKRVRLRGAGLQCVHSSRSTVFVGGLLAAGGGGHPQAVLNSLTSPGVLCMRAHAASRRSARACNVRLNTVCLAKGHSQM